MSWLPRSFCSIRPTKTTKPGFHDAPRKPYLDCNSFREIAIELTFSVLHFDKQIDFAIEIKKEKFRLD